MFIRIYKISKVLFRKLKNYHLKKYKKEIILHLIYNSRYMMSRVENVELQ